MQVTGMLYGARMLRFVGFPTSEVLGPAGPGAISAQGAKGAVSADGPESPERVQLNKALVGFLTHSGFTRPPEPRPEHGHSYACVAM
jgi:hypothetical protein